MARHRLLIHSARQVVQVVANKETVLKGLAMREVAVLGATNRSALHEDTPGDQRFSIVVDINGNIAAIGTDEKIRTDFKEATFDRIIDAAGKCVIPGLVDGHTHAVWAGDRVHEFALKLAGATYMEVHAAGGGIHFTVDKVHRATVTELYTNFKHYAHRMLVSGTTLAEVKTGYGLNTENELKMLEVLERARVDPEVVIDLSVTYCGAHAVPLGSSSEEATEDILKNQIPAMASKMASGSLHVDNVDVFCERGVFDVPQTRRILAAGKELGLQINFHGEELFCSHSAEMGAELGAHAISHLEEVSDEGIAAMAVSGTVATVLPTTAYILRINPPPVRKMIESNVAVALGSDFNPNAHCLSMPMVMHLACVLFRMTMTEALVAATINAAASLGKSTTHGSLEVGKTADMLLLDAPSWEHLIYQFGDFHHVISHVVKSGRLVHSTDQ